MQRFREAEVEDLDDAVGREAHVRRLEVPVHDAGLVRGLETLRDLTAHVDGFVDGQRTAREPRGEVLTGDELHREEARVVHLIDAVDARDVRMVQRRERLRLALEATQPLLVLGEALGQDLDRDLTPQARVLGPVDLAHPPGPEGTEDLVVGERLACGEGHAVQSLATTPGALPHQNVRSTGPGLEWTGADRKGGTKVALEPAAWGCSMRQLAIEPCVARPPGLADASGADRAEDLVIRERRARSQRHRTYLTRAAWRRHSRSTIQRFDSTRSAP